MLISLKNKEMCLCNTDVTLGTYSYKPPNLYANISSYHDVHTCMYQVSWWCDFIFIEKTLQKGKPEVWWRNGRTNERNDAQTKNLYVPQQSWQDIKIIQIKFY